MPINNPINVPELLTQVPSGLLIGGQWVPAADGATFTVENPATGEVLAQVASASSADAARALDAACAAQPSWAATSPRERADLLRQAFELVIARRDEFATLMTLEMGKPLAESQAEVTYGAEFLRWFSEEAVRVYGRTLTSPEGTLRMLTRRRPVGPCLLITPWNFPLAMATRKVAPAVAAGCTMVLKPAKLTPLTSLYFAQTMLDAGLPAGVLNVVTGASAAAISEPIMADPRLRKLSFTGSTPVGKQLLQAAAYHMLRTSLELGGNAPFIVFADADIDQAVAGAVAAKMRNIGQACTAANRFIVHASVAEEFTRKLAQQFAQLQLGNGLETGVTCGPLITPAAVENVSALVADALAHGATLHTGGSQLAGRGNFYPPTVLSNVPATARICREEIFGPVAPIITFQTEAEAIQIANDTAFGLAAYVYTKSVDRLWRVSDALECGLLGYNTGVISNAAAPFGGVKESGLGREGGAEGLEEYTTLQYIGIRDPYASSLC